MNSNYVINFNTLINDYYMCLGAFINCTSLYGQKDTFKINYHDTEEEKQIKKGMEADLLSNLGKVGEKAFKYVIGLENLKINPNQDVSSFEALWKKRSALKEFARKHGINEDDPDFIDLLNYYDENNQRAHNFDYWFSVINITMKETAKKFENYMKYNIQSNTLLKYCEEANIYRFTYLSDYFDAEEISLPFRTAIFPNLVELHYDNVPSVPDFQIKWMIDSKNKAIKKNGDIFTRMRYASNNPTNEKYNLDEVYEIVKNIVSFITLIHKENNNLDFDLIKVFAKNKSLEYADILKVSEDEINNLFSLDLTGEELALTIYEKNYSYKNIKDLLNIGIPKDKLRKVMRLRLKADNFIYFSKFGITSPKMIRTLIDYYNKFGEYPNSSKIKTLRQESIKTHAILK